MYIWFEIRCRYFVELWFFLYNKLWMSLFLFVSFFLSMLYVDAYISQSVVIKIAGEWWCIYWAAAILPTMTPIRLAWAFMISLSIQHSCLRLPSKYKFLCSGKSQKFAQKIPVEGNSFPRLRAQGSTRFWRRALDLLLSHCRKLLKSKIYLQILSEKKVKQRTKIQKLSVEGNSFPGSELRAPLGFGGKP